MLRRWDVGDVAAVVSAIQVSIEALSTWIPWFAGGVPTMESERAVFAAGAVDFDRDVDWAYSMFETTTSELVGSCALHHETTVPFSRSATGYAATGTDAATPPWLPGA
jgi:hypothetical protein